MHDNMKIRDSRAWLHLSAYMYISWISRHRYVLLEMESQGRQSCSFCSRYRKVDWNENSWVQSRTQQRNPEHSSLHGLQKITPSGLEFSSLQDLEKVNPSGLEHSIIQGLEKATPCRLVEKLKKIKQERVWCKESHPLNPDLRHPVCFAKQPSGTKQAFLTWLPGESFEELLVVAFFFLQLVEKLPGVALPVKTQLIFSPWFHPNSYRRQ